VRLGVDIGGTKTDVVAVVDGAIVARRRVTSGHGADAVVDATIDAVRHVLDDAAVSLRDVDGIGVGIPGTVVDGVVTYALNLGVDKLDLAAALERVWDRRPVVDNDVNVAALGAWSLGGRHGSLAYLNLGTGLAAGLILDGKLWRGARGAAGEIGHISIDPHGPVDADGMCGSIETYASGSGLVRQWGKPGAVARDVLDAAAAGDEQAQAIRQRLFLGLASAVRVLVLTFDVDAVVIGGGLTAYPGLLEGAGEVFSQWAATSDFLASLDLPGRVRVIDDTLPVAALGAAGLEA